VIDVETFSPWLLARPDRKLDPLAREEIERTGPADYFSVPIDFEQRFAGFDPRPEPRPRPAREIVIPATVAYWRFDSRDLRDLSGNGNHLVAENTPQWTSEYHRGQPAHGSVLLDGAYFRTVPDAPVNNRWRRRACPTGMPCSGRRSR
jgi:hypothetical protein